MKNRVMLVDDNRDAVDTLAAVLKMHGHETLLCYDAMDIVNCVRQFEPDWILLDIAMPRKSGWQAATEVRAMLPGKRPTIVAVTGETATDTNRHIANRIGFDYYLVKPVDPQVILKLLAG